MQETASPSRCGSSSASIRLDAAADAGVVTISPAWFHNVAQVVPALALALRMMATSRHATIRMLNDVCTAVRFWAAKDGIQFMQRPAVPILDGLDGDIAILQPFWHVKPHDGQAGNVATQLDKLTGTLARHSFANCSPRNALQTIGGFDDPGNPMRSVWCVVALGRQCARQLDDACRVVNRSIHGHSVVIPLRSDSRQYCLDQCACVLVIRQVDAIDQVAPFPESLNIRSGHPESRHRRHSTARARAARCSASVAEIPDGRLGSKSNNKNCRRTMLSDVVSLAKGFALLAARAHRSGFAGFNRT